MSTFALGSWPQRHNRRRRCGGRYETSSAASTFARVGRFAGRPLDASDGGGGLCGGVGGERRRAARARSGGAGRPGAAISPALGVGRAAVRRGGGAGPLLPWARRHGAVLPLPAGPATTGAAGDGGGAGGAGAAAADGGG